MAEEPGLKQFLQDSALSGSATEEELGFLERLRFKGKRPTALHYYRELQNFRDPLHACSCGPLAIERYRSRISGPLLDRIDIHLEVPAVAYGDLAGEQSGETSATIRSRVEQARAVQRTRFRDQRGVYANAHMSARDLRRHCRLSESVESVLRQAVTRLSLSARAYHRVLKIARTIADLAGAAEITTAHVSEAIQYRSLDRKREFA